MRCWTAHEGFVSALKCLRGAMLLTGSQDNTVKLWRNEQALQTFSGHESVVKCVDFLYASGTLISSGDDAQLKVWDATTGTCTMSLPVHRKPVFSAKYLDEAGLVATSGDDHCIKLWDLRRGSLSPVATMMQFANTVYSVDCHADQHLLVSGNSNGEVIMYDYRWPSEPLTTPLLGSMHPPSLSCIFAVKTDGKRVFCAGQSGSVLHLLSIHNSGSAARTVPLSHHLVVRGLALAPAMVATASWDGSVCAVNFAPTVSANSQACAVC
eukprot:TRINITY_DN1862_c0_g1_i3.p1 TRINITY_DN1862_c0_g1~~TRINITY_DN1862_c0_g1_i3.p1  ORF type:complete len:267 (-),score=49.40 TRINITY_DN1862_c0_g1_i3:49-849(-)